jgi:uncharacterized protein YjbI with pentapeptide repeats
MVDNQGGERSSENMNSSGLQGGPPPLPPSTPPRVPPPIPPQSAFWTYLSRPRVFWTYTIVMAVLALSINMGLSIYHEFSDMYDAVQPEMENMEELQALDQNNRLLKRIRVALEMEKDASIQQNVLQDLIALKVSLSGIQLADANLSGITLNSKPSPFSDEHADFSRSNFTRSEFSQAQLKSIDFSEANLEEVNFQEADLSWAILQEAHLTGARLEGVNLRYSTMRGADLSNADLNKAILDGADLRGANLQNARNVLSIQSLVGTNIHNIQNAPEGFVDWALDKGACQIEDDLAWRSAVQPEGELL